MLPCCLSKESDVREADRANNIQTLNVVEFLSLPSLRSNQREAKPSIRAVRGWNRLWLLFLVRVSLVSRTLIFLDAVAVPVGQFVAALFL